MHKEIICQACKDTGFNSKGNICAPCQRNGRQPLRNALFRALRDCFDGAHKQYPPNKEEILDIVEWVYGPHVMYAAGYRDEHGGIRMFAGPSLNKEEILKIEPENDDKGRVAFLVKLTKKVYKEKEIKPIARWKNGKWQIKKGS